MRVPAADSRPSLRVAAFARLDVVVRRLMRAVMALHQGVWLGLLDRRGLDQLGRRQYRGWRRYADPAYNQSGLWDWEERALDEHFAHCRSVLVAAGGGGREQLALARRGLETAGFDCVEELVASSRQLLAEEGFEAEVHLAPASEVPEELSRADGAVVGLGAYIHIPGSAQRVRFLRGLRRHLAPGAPLLVSFMTRQDDAHSYRWIAAVARFVRRLRGSREPVEIGDTLPATFRHHFTREQIAGELEEAGFELVEFAAEPYGHAVARAPATPH